MTLKPSLSILTPDPVKHRSFTDADAAVAYLEELYSYATTFLVEAFNRTAGGTGASAPSTPRSDFRHRAMIRLIRG